MASDLPKLGTNEEWRGIMKRARENDHKLTQKALAAAIGKLLSGDPPSQALISKIESGEIDSSEYVKPISEILGIALPEHFVNEDDRDWARLGRLLRSKNMDQFKKWLELLEGVAGKDEKAETDAAQPPPDRPQRK